MSIITDVYATMSREELYGRNWEDQLAKSVPIHCPPWCEGKHGRKEDLFHGRITELESVALHTRTLVETDSFDVVMVEEEAHPSSGLTTRRYFVLRSGPDCGDDPTQHENLDFVTQLALDLATVASNAGPALAEIERGEV